MTFWGAFSPYLFSLGTVVHKRARGRFQKRSTALSFGQRRRRRRRREIIMNCVKTVMEPRNAIEGGKKREREREGERKE